MKIFLFILAAITLLNGLYIFKYETIITYEVDGYLNILIAAVLFSAASICSALETRK